MFVPDAKDGFAFTLLKLASDFDAFFVSAPAQLQVGWRGHDVLALLILVNRIRQVVGFFEKDVAHAKLRRVCGGAHAGRSRTNNGDFVQVRQITPLLPENCNSKTIKKWGRFTRVNCPIFARLLESSNEF